MKQLSICIFFLFLFFRFSAAAQYNIYTSEGLPVLDRMQLIDDCLSGLKKDRSDQVALAVCECQADKLNGRFSKKEYRHFTKKSIIDLAGLIRTDSLLDKELQDCFTASGKTILLSAERFEQGFLSGCSKLLHGSSEKKLDSFRVDRFCQCQLQLVKAKKSSDEELKAIEDPNSLLFFEMIYRCGDPFAGKDEGVRNWSLKAGEDLKGPAADTVNLLTINGMTYVKVKLGSLVKVWLFDTGAADLLINTEMETQLKKENILTEAGYLGTGDYEMANGTVESCRRYRVNGVRIGAYTADNVLLAVSEKGKRIIVGKSLLNKFRTWTVNNQENKLLLVR